MDELASFVGMIIYMIREQQKEGDRYGVMKSDAAHVLLHWRRCVYGHPVCYRYSGSASAQYSLKPPARWQCLRLNDAEQAAAGRAFLAERVDRSGMFEVPCAVDQEKH